MSALEAIERAMTEVAEFFAPRTFPQRVLRDQISIHQQEIFTAAAEVDVEYYAVCAMGTPDANGLFSLTTLDGTGEAPPPIERIAILRIEDPGTAPYAMGDEVHVVPVRDPDIEEPPRVYQVNRQLRAVGADLAGVATVQIWYSRRPVAITADSTELEVEDPFSLALVYDLARFIAHRTPAAPRDVRTAAVEYFVAQEKRVMDSFLLHVAGYAMSRSSRFD